MPVNTNDLRDMASEFRGTTFTEMVIEAANQLDSTRTERNILRAELDAAREELREVREAALSALGLLDDPSCPVTGLDETRRARAILAAALKAPPHTRARRKLVTTLRDDIAMAICMASCGMAAHRSDYMADADAAILALCQWLADEGLVVVPREATPTMSHAGESYMETMDDDAYAQDVWHNMIAAAPDALKAPDPAP